MSKYLYLVMYYASSPLILFFMVRLAFERLGVDVYGGYLHYYMIYLISVTVTVLAFSNYALREYVASGLSRDKFNHLIRCQLLLSLPSIFFGFLYSLFDEGYIFFLLPSFFSFFCCDWYFIARRDYRSLFFRTFFVRFFSIVGVYFFVGSGDDFYIYVLIMVGVFSVLNLAGFVIAVSGSWAAMGSVFLGMREGNSRFIFNELFKAKYFYLISLVGVSYQYVDQLLLGFFSGAVELSKISIIKQFIFAALIVPTMICSFLSPVSIASAKRSGFWSRIGKIFMYYFLFSIFLSVCINFISPVFYEFVSYGRIVLGGEVVFLASMFFLITSISIFINTQICIPLLMERANLFSNIVVCVCVLCVIFVSGLYFDISHVGVVSALVLGEFFGALVMSFFVFRHYKCRSSNVV